MLLGDVDAGAHDGGEAHAAAVQPMLHGGAERVSAHDLQHLAAARLAVCIYHATYGYAPGRVLVSVFFRVVWSRRPKQAWRERVVAGRRGRRFGNQFWADRGR